MRIYLVFYILFLESINLETLIQDKLFKLLLKNKYKIEIFLIIINIIGAILLNRKIIKK